MVRSSCLPDGAMVQRENSRVQVQIAPSVQSVQPPVQRNQAGMQRGAIVSAIDRCSVQWRGLSIEPRQLAPMPCTLHPGSQAATGEGEAINRTVDASTLSGWALRLLDGRIDRQALSFAVVNDLRPVTHIVRQLVDGKAPERNPLLLQSEFLNERPGRIRDIHKRPLAAVVVHPEAHRIDICRFQISSTSYVAIASARDKAQYPHLIERRSEAPLFRTVRHPRSARYGPSPVNMERRWCALCQQGWTRRQKRDGNKSETEGSVAHFRSLRWVREWPANLRPDSLRGAGLRGARGGHAIARRAHVARVCEPLADSENRPMSTAYLHDSR